MGEKIFIDTRTQIKLLKSRGLNIRNEKWAKQIIRYVNYYNLINGYKDPFLQSNKPDKYIPNSTLEEIYALYNFDRKLRLITIEYILEIEKQLKSIIAYVFSKRYGHKDYLKPENFDIENKEKSKNVDKLLKNLNKKIELNKKDPSLSHYEKKKKYIPLWVLVNSISFTDISKFYSNMLQSERSDVSRRIKWGLKEKELSSCLFFLSSIRNRCAHDERLYSYLSYVNLSNNGYFKYFGISHKYTNNYFAVIVAFKMILPNNRYSNYIKEINSLFNELSHSLNSINFSKVRKSMGIPHNWLRIDKLNLVQN